MTKTLRCLFFCAETLHYILQSGYVGKKMVLLSHNSTLILLLASPEMKDGSEADGEVRRDTMHCVR